MKIKVKANMFPPSNQLFIGGRNYPIFSKEDIEVELNPGQILLIMQGRIKIPIYDNKFLIVGIRSYDEKLNLMTVSGHLPNINDVQAFINYEWKPDFEAMRKYRITIPS